MSASRAFATTAFLARVTTISMFGLMVLGSVVRTTGSGLACPDWPLCEGRFVPRFEYHVLLEWGHRTVALLVSLLLFATTLSVVLRRDVRSRLFGLVGLAVVLLFAQILLGALTVWKLLHPSVVSSHLGVAVLLFGTTLTLSLAAEAHADDEAAAESGRAPDVAASGAPTLLAAGYAAVTLLTYAQIIFGGALSTNHAVAVCPDWPTCQGEWFPAMSGLVGIHMSHRWLGYIVAASILGVAIAARSAPLPIRVGGRLALTLVAGQTVLGVCNVLLQAPTWVSAMHLAMAIALFGVLMVTTYRLFSLPAAEARWVVAKAS